jgi:hypothetical protein
MAIRTPQSLDDFDFWVGSWHGTWDGGAAVNVVEKLYDGRVIVERFAAERPEPFSGMSLSVLDEAAGCWKQTWADNTGNYLDFVGGAVGEEMHLTRDAQVGGKDILQRMRWAAIKADAFQWFWQRREDGGEWETIWHISYVRAEAGSVV